MKQIPKVERKKVDDVGYFEPNRKKKPNKKFRGKYETLHKEIRKKKQKTKMWWSQIINAYRSGSMTRAETLNYTAEVLSRRCSKTLRKSLKRKHTYPQGVLLLSQKMVTSFFEKKKTKRNKKFLDRWAEYISKIFEDPSCWFTYHERWDPGSNKKDEIRQSKRQNQYISGTFRSTWSLWKIGIN